MQSIPLPRDTQANGLSTTGLSPRRAMVLFGLALTSGVLAIAWWDWEHERLAGALEDFRRIDADAFVQKYA